MSNPFAADTELVILSLLSDEPGGLYGLELVRLSDEKLKRGSVYVTLGRLEEKGYVHSRAKRDSSHSGLPRPRYTITGHGKRVLDAAAILGKKLARA